MRTMHVKGTRSSFSRRSGHNATPRDATQGTTPRHSPRHSNRGKRDVDRPHHRFNLGKECWGELSKSSVGEIRFVGTRCRGMLLMVGRRDAMLHTTNPTDRIGPAAATLWCPFIYGGDRWRCVTVVTSIGRRARDCQDGRLHAWRRPSWSSGSTAAAMAERARWPPQPRPRHHCCSSLPFSRPPPGEMQHRTPPATGPGCP